MQIPITSVIASSKTLLGDASTGLLREPETRLYPGPTWSTTIHSMHYMCSSIMLAKS